MDRRNAKPQKLQPDPHANEERASEKASRLGGTELNVTGTMLGNQSGKGPALGDSQAIPLRDNVSTPHNNQEEKPSVSVMTDGDIHSKGDGEYKKTDYKVRG